MVSEEDRNPVETEMESFFTDCQQGGHPKADLEVGLNDSIAVMLSNMAMEQERRVRFDEIDKMGIGGKPSVPANAAPAAAIKKA